MDQISVPPTRDSAGLAVSSLDRLAPPVFSILRIMAALLVIEHGLAKFFGFPVRTMEAPALFDLEWFAAAIEFGGGVLLALGLFTRAVALMASGEMAISYFLFHPPQGFKSVCQPRRTGDHVLLRFSLSGVRRRRTVEPRRAVVGQARQSMIQKSWKPVFRKMTLQEYCSSP